MTDAIASFGVTVSWNGETVAELLEVSGVKVAAEFKDVTSHGSASGFREKIPTLLNAENMTIRCNFIASDAAQQAMTADIKSKTKRTVIITFPDSITATWTAECYMSDFEITDLSFDGGPEFTATLTPTGEPTLAITATTGPTNIVVTGDQSGTLTPVPTYAAGEYSYIIDGSAENSVTVTVTAAGADTITVNGSSVVSGVASAAISLTGGEITTITVVVTETGKVPKTYVIRVSDGL